MSCQHLEVDGGITIRVSDRKSRKEFCHGVINGDLVLGLELGKHQGGEYFGDRANSENGVLGGARIRVCDFSNSFINLPKGVLIIDNFEGDGVYQTEV